jgi:hypothetical protein
VYDNLAIGRTVVEYERNMSGFCDLFDACERACQYIEYDAQLRHIVV